MIDRKAIKSINDRLVAQGIDPIIVAKFNTAHGEHGKFAPRGGGGAGAPKGGASETKGEAKGGGKSVVDGPDATSFHGVTGNGGAAPAKTRSGRKGDPYGIGQDDTMDTALSRSHVGHNYQTQWNHPAPAVNDKMQVLGFAPGVHYNHTANKLEKDPALEAHAKSVGYVQGTGSDIFRAVQAKHATQTDPGLRTRQELVEHHVMVTVPSHAAAGWGFHGKGKPSDAEIVSMQKHVTGQGRKDLSWIAPKGG